MLKNMKIRMRMLVSYSIIILLTIISSIVSIVMIKNVGASLTEFYNKQFQTTNESWTARRAVFASQSNLFQALIETDDKEINTCLTSAEEEYAKMTEAIPKIRAVFQGDMTLLDSIDSLTKEATTYKNEIINQISSKGISEAYSIMKNDYIPLTDQIRAELIEIGSQADANAKARVTTGEESTVLSVIIVCIISVISVLIAIIFCIKISNSIRKPVEEIEEAAHNISMGNLNTTIHYQGKDELGDLANSMRETVRGLSDIITDLSYLMTGISKGNFNLKSKNTEGYIGDFKPILDSIRTMNDSLSDTMRQINQASEQVSTGADQVSCGAQALSQGATEQASSVEELAASIDEISQHVNRNAQCAIRSTGQYGC